MISESEPVRSQVERTWPRGSVRDSSGTGSGGLAERFLVEDPASGGWETTCSEAILSSSTVSEWIDQPVVRNLLPIGAGCAARGTQATQTVPSGLGYVALIYCAKGTGWCNAASERHSVRAGQLLVIPAKGVFTFGSDGSTPWTIWWIHAVGTHVNFFVDQLGVSPTKPVCDLRQDAQLLVLFDELVAALQEAERSRANLLYASQTLAHLLGTMIWLHAQSGKAEMNTANRIKQSIAYMKQHLNKPMQVGALAALVKMSPSHYTAMFKRQTGCAPIEYFIRLRMRQACCLLKQTALSVKEIAAALGYDDPFYFSRMFKSVNEVAPSGYRVAAKGPALSGFSPALQADE